MRTSRLAQHIILGMLVIQLLSGCSTPLEPFGRTSPLVATNTPTTLPLAKMAPTVIPTRTEKTQTKTPFLMITPTTTKTPIPMHVGQSDVCPTITTANLIAGVDKLYLYLDWRNLFQYDPLRSDLRQLTEVQLNTGTPHLSPNGMVVYWIKDGKLTLFDIERVKTTATYSLPEGSGHGVGWTRDGKILLEKMDISDVSDLTGVEYTILDPSDFQILTKRTYDLKYPALSISMKYGGFIAFSPNGNKVLYSDIDERVYLYDIEVKRIIWRSEKFKWTFDSGQIPARSIWTQDGKWVIFAAARNESQRIIFALSEDGSTLRDLAVLDNEMFLGNLRLITVSDSQRYIHFPLHYAIEKVKEPLSVDAGQGYLLDREQGKVKTICLKDRLFIGGRFQGDLLFFDVIHPQEKKIEVWVLEPNRWMAQKLFEFSTNDIYNVMGRDFELR